jgi:hypothetical protein
VGAKQHLGFAGQTRVQENHVRVYRCGNAETSLQAVGGIHHCPFLAEALDYRRGLRAVSTGDDDKRYLSWGLAD